MKSGLLNVGYGNVVLIDKVIAIVSASAAPVKRLKEEALRENRLIDATCGRKTRAVVITISNHIVLSSIHPETLSQRFEGEFEKDEIE